MGDSKREEDAEKKRSLKKGVDEILNPEHEVPSPPVEQKPPVPEQSDSKSNDLPPLPAEEELEADSIDEGHDDSSTIETPNVENVTEEVHEVTKTVDAEPQEELSEQDVEASVPDETVKDSKPEIETEPEVAPVPQKPETEPAPSKPEETAVIAFEVDSTPLTPKLGKITDESIEVLHSIGDIHGWAPGLISYLIKNKLAEIEVNGFPLQDKNGNLHQENLEQVFPNPINILKRTSRNPPRAGLGGQPGFDNTGINDDGHGAIKARWIAQPNVALVQIGDVYDRADHSELAAEVLRQLMIDAPGKVFVLVGNHEQFMLEEDYDNWYFNEARNAFIDSDSRPAKDTRNHFRFLPTWDGKTPTERANSTFDRYVNSTWTLFLTQGAIMEELGWIKPDVDLKPMLETGWSGYEHAIKMKKEFDAGRWGKIPGAITALVIADTLFHHAEPAAHRTDDGQGLKIPLSETMESVNSKNNNILFRQYTPGGGDLKGSPDAPLLWSRGSSSGASSGNPAAESHLEGLTKSWPGLRRIVHGHTPTPGSGHFDSVTNGKSTTVSYLGESASRQSTKGRANKIRIYNIDEGMSPPYYIGDDSIYSPTRMPTGLRIETDEYSAIEAKSASSQMVQIDSKNSIDVDVRNLWRWSPKQWRSSAESNWGSSDSSRTYQSVVHGSWKGYISTNTKTGESTRGLLDRNAGTTQISKLMIQKMMTNVLSDNAVKVQEPRPVVMERIPKVGKLLSENKVKDAWNQLDVILLLLKPDPKGGFSLICINSTTVDWEEEFELINFTGSKKGKKAELFCKAKTITHVKINDCEKLFISRSGESITQAIEEWNEGKDDVLKSNSSPVIAYYSDVSKPDKKLVVKTVKEIELIAKPAPVKHNNGNSVKWSKTPEYPKKNGQWASSGYGSSSQGKATSLGEQGTEAKEKRAKEEKGREIARNQQQTLGSQSSKSKASHQQQTQPKANSPSKDLSAQGSKSPSRSPPPPPPPPPPPKEIQPDSRSSNKSGQQQKDLRGQQSQSQARKDSGSRGRNQGTRTSGANSQRQGTTSGQNKTRGANQSKTKVKVASNENEAVRVEYDGNLIKFSSKIFGFLANVTGAVRVEVRFEPRQREDIDSYNIDVQIKNNSNYILLKFKTVVVDGKYTKFKQRNCKLNFGRKKENVLWSTIRDNEKLLHMIKEHKKSLYDKGKK